jgi:hypothetical protein
MTIRTKMTREYGIVPEHLRVEARAAKNLLHLPQPRSGIKRDSMRQKTLKPLPTHSTVGDGIVPAQCTMPSENSQKHAVTQFIVTH